MEMGTAATDAATKVKTFKQLMETIGEALQSGWTQSWEYIIGDFEQAKRFWTEISDIMNFFIGKSAESRNNILEAWSKATYSYDEDGKLMIKQGEKLVAVDKMENDLLGGREAVIQGLRNTFQSMFEIAIEFNKAWDKSFLGKGTKDSIELTSKKLIDMSHSFLDFTQGMKDSLTRDKKGNPTGLLKEIADSFDLLASAARSGYNGLAGIFSGLGNIGSSLFKSSFFSVDTLNSLISVISTITGKFAKFGEVFRVNFGKNASGTNQSGLVDFFNGLAKAIDAIMWVKIDFIANAFDALMSVLQHLIPYGETAASLLGKVGEKLGAFGDTINAVFGNEDVSNFEGLFKGIANGLNSFFDQKVDFSLLDGIGFFINQLTSGDLLSQMGVFDIVSNVVNSAVNVFKSLLSVVLPIASAFTDVFGPSLYYIIGLVRQITDRIAAFTSNLVLNANQMNGLHKIFEGVFGIVKALASIIVEGLISAWDGLGDILSAILPDADSFGNTLNDIGDKLKGFAEALQAFAGGETELPTLGDVILSFAGKVKKFVEDVKSFTQLEIWGQLFKSFMDTIKSALFGTSEISLLDGIGAKIKEAMAAISEAFTGENGLDMGDIVAAGGVVALIKKIIEFFQGLSDKVLPVSGFIDTFKEIGEAISGLSDELQNRVKVDTLKSTAVAMLELAAALWIVSSIDSAKLFSAVGAIGTMLAAMKTSIEDIVNLKADAGSMMAAAAMIKNLGLALLLIAVAVAILGRMSLPDLAKGLGSVILLITVLTSVAEQFSKFDMDLARGSGALVAMALALLILCAPVKILGGMDWKSLAKGLAGTVALMFSLAYASKQMEGMKFSSGAGLLLMAAGIAVLAKAVKDIAGLPLDQLIPSLIAVIALIFSLSYAASIVPDGMLSVGAGLLLMAIGIKVIADAIADLMQYDIQDLGNRLLLLGVAMVGFVAVANALKDSMTGAASIAIIAAALVPLAIALKLISTIPLPQLATSLLAVAVAIGIFVVAAKLLTPIVGSLIAVSAALALFGIAMLGIGVGFAALAIGVSTGGSALLLFLQQLLTLAPSVGVAIANLLLSLISSLANAASSIASAVVQIVSSIISALMTLAPQVLTLITTLGVVLYQAVIMLLPLLLNAVMLIILGILNVIAENIGPIVEAGLNIIVNFINGIASGIGLVIDAAFNLIVSFIDGLATAIDSNGGALLGAVQHLLSSLLNFILSSVSMLVPGAMQAVSTFVQTIIGNSGKTSSGATSLISQLLSSLLSGAARLASAGIAAVSRFVSAILGKVGSAANAGRSLANAAGNAIRSVGTWFSSGLNAAQGFINGITSKIGGAVSAAASLAKSAWNAVKSAIGEHSPARKLHDSGVNFVRGFANGIGDTKRLAVESASDMALATMAAFDNGLDDDYQPTITPVIDLSNVQNGMGTINDLMSSVGEVHAVGTIDYTKAMADEFSSYANQSKQSFDAMASILQNSLDYNKLGDAVADSLVRSGIYVKMDGSQVMGYIAGEIQGSRRMFA